MALNANANAPRMPQSNQVGYTAPNSTGYGGPPSTHGSGYGAPNYNQGGPTQGSYGGYPH